MENLSAHIEYTNLRPDVTQHQLDELIQTAKNNQYYGVCVPPFWVKRIAREKDPSLQLVTVIGFPIGYQMTETKVRELEVALDNGADEVDLVMNVSAFKSDMTWSKIEFAKCAKITHDHGKLLKIILETSLLTTDEIVTAAKWAADAGADFVKTSTGFIGEGAKVEHIQLLRASIPSSVGIKASGGIKTKEQAIELIRAGADRIGTSSAL